MGTVFSRTPVVRSWESYTSQIVNAVCKVFFLCVCVDWLLKLPSENRRVMENCSFGLSATRRLSSSCVILLQIVILVPLKIYPFVWFFFKKKKKKKATITSGRQTNCLDIHHNSFKNYVWLTARWTWGFSATPLQIDVGWQRYTEP